MGKKASSDTNLDFKKEVKIGLKEVKKRRGPEYLKRVEAGNHRRARHCSTVDEIKIQIANAKDKLVLIEFFTMWCDTCSLCKPGISEFRNQIIKI